MYAGHRMGPVVVLLCALGHFQSKKELSLRGQVSMDERAAKFFLTLHEANAVVVLFVWKLMDSDYGLLHVTY